MQGICFQDTMKDVAAQRLPAHIILLAPDLLLLVLQGIPALTQLIVLPALKTSLPLAMFLLKLSNCLP